MIAATVSDLLDGKIDALDTGECCIYVVRGDDVVLYVGKARNPIERLRAHLGRGYWGQSSGPSPLGQLLLMGSDVVRACRVEFLKVEDCAPIIHGQFPRAILDVDIAELVLIRTYRPCLNITNNADPMPLPQRYAARPTDSSARYLAV